MNVREPLPTAETQLPKGDLPPPSRRGYLIVVLLVLLALAWGAYGRWQRDEAALQTQQQILNFVPEVRVAIVKRQDGSVMLTLPGGVLPFDQARIYARATGYIAERRVDIGSRVHAGDLLVRIAAPDLDHQLSEAQARLGQIQAAMEQARAAAEQAHSDAALADVTNSRTLRLATQGWESKQNADNTRLGLASKLAGVANAEAGVRVAEANVRAQEATVQRLLQLTQYEKVEAPFNGVITARNVDNGDLVKADDNSGGTALFTVHRDDVVRVQVNVPQSGAVGLQDGLPAKVHVPELPGRIFEGKVARNSVALDAASRTMVAELMSLTLMGRCAPAFMSMSTSAFHARPPPSWFPPKRCCLTGMVCGWRPWMTPVTCTCTMSASTGTMGPRSNCAKDYRAASALSSLYPQTLPRASRSKR